MVTEWLTCSRHGPHYWLVCRNVSGLKDSRKSVLGNRKGGYVPRDHDSVCFFYLKPHIIDLIQQLICNECKTRRRVWPRLECVTWLMRPWQVGCDWFHSKHSDQCMLSSTQVALTRTWHPARQQMSDAFVPGKDGIPMEPPASSEQLQHIHIYIHI